MHQLFDKLLLDALSQPVHISTNTQEEARENLFYFGLAEAKLSLAPAPTLDAWLQAVVAGKRQQLLQQQGNSYAMQFYCWHDAQAAQLRFSLVAAAAPLPFGCALRLTALSEVVHAFLTSERLLFDENLFDVHSAAGQLATEQMASEKFVLPVWRTVIP